ncbi:MAG: HAMP domain-containing protein, partial [Comamonadaceae bacterium]
MRTAKLSTWLLRGTYPRLYVPIALIILLVSAVRYHYLVATEIQEVHRQGAIELRRAGDALLPGLADLPPADLDAAATLLNDGLARLGPWIGTLKWQVPGQPEVEATAPAVPTAAPAWFSQWVEIDPPVQQFGQAVAGGGIGRLTVTVQAAPLINHVWDTVVVQLRISALNIFTILFLLTLLLRANARMLRRLAEATNAFRHGRLDTRMDVAGTLESRAMAETFNDMAGKVQSLVLSLRETQH